MNPKLKPGNIVNVLRVAAFKGTVKIPAEVVSVGKDKFDVRALREPFDEDGHTMMALQFAGHGRTWK